MRKLYEIADSQGGLFSAAQAVAAGIRSTNHTYYVSTGQWQRVSRGVYRLEGISPTPDDHVRVAQVWSRSKEGVVSGIVSHESALDVYGITGVSPSSVHMYVPKGFRRRLPDEPSISLHFGSLEPDDKRVYNGIWLTTAWRTICDLFEAGDFSLDYLEEAYVAGRRNGLISEADLRRSHLLPIKYRKYLDKWEKSVNVQCY